MLFNREQNIEDTLPELKNLIAVGKNYQKALQSNSQYYDEVARWYLTMFRLQMLL